jgi:hypothetical protein
MSRAEGLAAARREGTVIHNRMGYARECSMLAEVHRIVCANRNFYL